MNVDEKAPDVFRLSLYVPEMNIQFLATAMKDVRGNGLHGEVS